MKIPTRRDYRARLAIAGRYIGSVEEYAGGHWHSGDFLSFPTPAETWQDATGIFDSNPVTVLIDDSEGQWRNDAMQWRGQAATIELVTRREYNDGTSDEESITRRYVVRAWRILPGQVELSLRGADYLALEQLYPRNTFTTDDWPDIYPDHGGWPIAEVVGLARHVQCAYLSEDSGLGTGPWVFGAAELSGAAISVLTVYADGRVVDPSNYIVSSRVGASTGVEVQTLEFSVSPLGADGQLRLMTVDCQSTRSRNAATELEYLLGVAGLGTDASSFASAASEAVAREMYVDWGYRRRVTLRSIIEPYLGLLRANIGIDGSGNVVIYQDTLSSVSHSFAEQLGDLIQTDFWGEESAPQSVSLQFGQLRADPDQTLYEITRTVAGGTDPAEPPVVCPWINDFSTADRYLSYLQRSREYANRASATVYDLQLALDDVIQITDSPLWAGSKNWFVRSITRSVDANQIELEEYNSNLWSYIPGVPPAGFTTGYIPDFSLTPPAAPVNLQVIGQGTDVDSVGKVFAWVDLQGQIPSVNAVKLWFTARNDANSTLTKVEGDSIGSNNFATRIGGLAPSQQHTFFATAENGFGLQGPALSVVSTTPGHSAIPPAPTSMFVFLLTGNMARIDWQLPSAVPDLSGFEIWFRQGSGSYGFTGRVGAATFKFIDGPYGYSATPYQWRVRTIDTSGNVSSWTESPLLTVTQNIGDTDINPSDPIGTTKIVDTLIGKTITTASSGKRVEMQRTTNEIRFYDSGGTLVGAAGLNTLAGDQAVFSADTDQMGFQALTNGALPTCWFENNSNRTAMEVRGGNSSWATMQIQNNSTNEQAIRVVRGTIALQAMEMAYDGRYFYLVFPNGWTYYFDSATRTQGWI